MCSNNFSSVKVLEHMEISLMKFSHNILVDIEDNREGEIEDGIRRVPLIVLNDNVDFVFKDKMPNNPLTNEEYTIVAQAISLDIRGDFGFFLNKRKENKLDYEWAGNLFHITVRQTLERVEITDILGEEITYNIPWGEWEEALIDWKQFYLKELGFLEFDTSQALSHVVGILVLTFDQMTEGVCEMEMITEAIRRCSERYGICKSVLYRDCKKTLGLECIEEFYLLSCLILEDQYRRVHIFDYIRKNRDCKKNLGLECIKEICFILECQDREDIIDDILNYGFCPIYYKKCMFDKMNCRKHKKFCYVNNFFNIRKSFRHKLGLEKHRTK